MNSMSQCLLLLLAIFGTQVFAKTNIEWRIRGDQTNRVSTIDVGGHLAPAQWDLVTGIPVADSIIPGTPVNSEEVLKIYFTNGSHKVRIDHYLAGMEYLFSDDFVSVTATEGTAIVQGSGRELRAIGTGLSNREYHFASTQAPFVGFRPLFKKRDDAAVISLFKNSRAPKGIYRGMIQSSVTYDYIRDGVRVRQTVPFITELVYNYNPAIINSVNIISGNGVIEPRYYGYPQKLVGGETNYQLQVLGDFQSGLKMGLRSSKHLDGLYALRSAEEESRGRDTKITYNVRCTNGCMGSGEIVKDGQAMIGDTNNRIDIIPAEPTENATINININFGNKPLSEIQNGLYQDSFVLVFETLI